ncbi:MAG TPA: DUF29 domain-containing protein [Alphaproteobacteria bacterium]|nr:DUF29 domain-containing protein [Alphaproteobacteria bacterium]
MSDSAYDRDYFAWLERQRDLLGAGRLAEADLPNLAEEMGDLARQEKRHVLTRLVVLLAHLLEWRHAPMLRGGNRQTNIADQRAGLAARLDRSPSLRPVAEMSFADCYARAVRAAALGSGLPAETFPNECPWTLAQVLEPDFLPEE